MVNGQDDTGDVDIYASSRLSVDGVDPLLIDCRTLQNTCTIYELLGWLERTVPYYRSSAKTAQEVGASTTADISGFGRVSTISFPLRLDTPHPHSCSLSTNTVKITAMTMVSNTERAGEQEERELGP